MAQSRKSEGMKKTTSPKMLIVTCFGNALKTPMVKPVQYMDRNTTTTASYFSFYILMLNC